MARQRSRAKERARVRTDVDRAGWRTARAQAPAPPQLIERSVVDRWASTRGTAPRGHRAGRHSPDADADFRQQDLRRAGTRNSGFDALRETQEIRRLARLLPVRSFERTTVCSIRVDGDTARVRPRNVAES